ncbi:MAG: DUF3885 domain-containing protein [Clostridiales bacterium]|nr:DUF3885 domain-containing protein [Clostridiales bacterium]
MDKDLSSIEKMILDRDFKYEPPYFYNNALALRCELGIGDTNEEYLANAKSRAEAIYHILFENGVDMFFFDSYMYDWDFDMGDTVYINRVVSTERDKLKFCLGYQKKFKHKVVRDIPVHEADRADICRRNRICCYPDEKFNAVEALNAQIDEQLNPIIHWVSFTNDCIFTVYDDRGCDVVFYDKNNFVKFYPLLKKYFLDYDLGLMEQRYNDNI